MDTADNTTEIKEEKQSIDGNGNANADQEGSSDMASSDVETTRSQKDVQEEAEEGEEKDENEAENTLEEDIASEEEQQSDDICGLCGNGGRDEPFFFYHVLY
jgi:hypothetical protein